MLEYYRHVRRKNQTLLACQALNTLSEFQLMKSAYDLAAFVNENPGDSLS